MIDHEELKNLPNLDEAQQHALFASYMNRIEQLSDDEFLICMGNFGIFCTKFITSEEMKLLTAHLSNYIQKRGAHINQITELCGFYFKLLDPSCQKQLFSAIFSASQAYENSIRGIVAITRFLRDACKALSAEQLQHSISFLRSLNIQPIPVLHDTIEYTEENLQRTFSPTADAKVLLLIPEFLSGSSFLQPPICMMQVVSDLAERGVVADLLDNRVYHYSIDQVARLIGSHYRYIAVTSSPIDQYQAYFTDKRFAVFANTVNAIQRQCKYQRLIVCGSHGTVDPGLLLNDISPDIILQGSYESRLGDLIAQLDAAAYPDTIHGIVFRLDDGSYVTSSAPTPSAELNREFRIVDYSLIDLNDYYGYSYAGNVHVIKKRWAILQTTKGCPYNCIFCFNIYGKKVIHQSVQNVIMELKQLEKQGCRELFFIDQTFTVNRTYTMASCQSMIENEIHIEWQCETRVDLIDEDILILMKKAGCKSIWIGIESFDGEVLLKNQKDYRTSQLMDLIRLLDQNKVDYSAFIMFGMYGDTVRSLNNTVDMIIQNNIRTSKSLIQCIPRPGTRLYMKLSEPLRANVRHFWQIDSLRGAFNENLTQKDIDLALGRLNDAHRSPSDR